MPLVYNMASSSVLFTCLFAVLLVQPGVSDPLKDFLGPILAPVMDDVCKLVECGKGECRPSAGALSFVCECEDGWKQALAQDNDDDFKFLPCVIPNCTVDYSCSSAPSPAPPKGNATMGSIFDPCNWASCGEGTCNKTSAFTHNCECKEGYSNLLNVTSFPCLKECSIGMDCLKLGIPLANTTPPASPTLPDKSEAIGILDRSVYFVVSLVIYSSLMTLQ